jgi:hypothetical protein
MILILKTPYNPGDADPGKLYTHLHLELMVYNASAYTVQLSYAYGSLDSDNLFVCGKGISLQSVSLSGEDLTTLQSEMPKPQEPALPASVRLAYEHLKTALGVEGTLDYNLPATPGAPKPAQTPASTAPSDPVAPSTPPSADPAPAAQPASTTPAA